jgi:hypothetical protein
VATVRLAQFKIDIARANDLVGFGQSLGKIMHGRVDESDMYRSGLVQGVSALDSYVHGVVLDRAVNFIMGRLIITIPPAKAGLHLGAVQALLDASSPADLESLARGSIAQRLSKETYQKPDDIAQALAMVGVPRIWSTSFSRSAGRVKQSLSLTVQRRNQIVHQCDVDPLFPGTVVPLSHTDALNAIKEIENIVISIDSYC